MGESYHWSVQIGRWHRVSVRVHALFVAAAVLVMFLATNLPHEDALFLGAAGVLVLLLSVLAHEMGHAFAAARVGGGSDAIVLGPLGGMGPVDVPREPQSDLLIVLAGPLVNLAIGLLCLPVLFAARIDFTQLLSPWQPVGLTEGAWWAIGLKLTFWTNWLILVVNLLPAFPFDGARLLRTLLLPALDFRSATGLAVRASGLTVLGICLLSWSLADEKCAEVLPVWVPLLLLATLMYFAAKREAALVDESQWDEEASGYDFSQGYTSLERSLERRHNTSLFRRWLQERRERRRRRRLSVELDEERQVDSILVRLHETGMEGLTPHERALLNRVSARYRSRPQ